MTYSVRVQRIGKAGVPTGKAILYEAGSEIEAVTIAAYEVDAHQTVAQRIATVLCPSGRLVLAYAGRARRVPCRPIVKAGTEPSTIATPRS